MITIGIIGSRGYIEKNNLVRNTIQRLKDMYKEDLLIISGGAIGVDSVVRYVCDSLDIKFIEYKPDFSEGYNVRKYHERNNRIINNSDKVIAFWDGKSPGTKSIIEKCISVKKPIEVILY